MTTAIDSSIFCNKIVVSSYQSVSVENPVSNQIKDLSVLLKNEFTILNPRITKISFGSYDYSSDEANDISVTFVPEWCELIN